MAHQLKYPVLSLLWRGFHPWRWNFHVLQSWPEKKNQKHILFVANKHIGTQVKNLVKLYLRELYKDRTKA